MMQSQVTPLSERIGALLQQHGWSLTDGAALAVKAFPTAVGDKTAAVYVHNWPEQVFLHGSYDSEGRNVLESWGQLIGRNSPPEVLEAEVLRFVRNNERAVLGSYAARLLARQNELKNASFQETQ